jgi:hypothetical protein
VQITVDGVDYVPAGRAARFGVAITTRNRPDRLNHCLEQFRANTPAGVPILVVDDASDPPAAQADHRFPTNVGIATAKNKCLELLLKAGVEHLFLFDDDAYPISDGWWEPYVASREPHLFAVFPEPTSKSSHIRVLYQDEQHVAYHATRGYALYFERRVIEKVGGFDPRFFNAFEHVELSNRIHNAGLTAWPYQDVVGSEHLILCEDAHGGTSVIPDSTRRDNEALGRRLLEECAGRTDFVPFGSTDLILSALFTGRVDPQRGTHLPNDPQLADGLLRSLNGATAVVLCDFDTTEPKFLKVPASVSPYIQRWISYREYLLRHPEIRFVWCVDATDVEALRDPFDGMEPGVLYCGWENQIVGCPWMLKNHEFSREWITANANRTLLNAGVVGADRTTMLEFTRRLIGLWSSSVVAKREDKVGDMGHFNEAAYSMTVQTGPRITTLFKANQRTEHSKWRHK